LSMSEASIASAAETQSLVSSSEHDLEANETCGKKCGRICACILWEIIDIPVLIFLGLLLYVTMDVCIYCVVAVGAFSAVLCLRWRMLQITFWASVIVLWLHGWKMTAGWFSIAWTWN
jgi:hypothetical protein